MKKMAGKLCSVVYSKLAFQRTQNFGARLVCSERQATFLSNTFLSNGAFYRLSDVIFLKKIDVLNSRLACSQRF